MYLITNNKSKAEHSSASGAFTVVEVVADWHWL